MSVELIFGLLMFGAIGINTVRTGLTYGSDLEDAKKSVEDASSKLETYAENYGSIEKMLSVQTADLARATQQLSSDISDKQLQIRDMQQLFVAKLRSVEIVGITLIFGIIFLFALKKLKII